MYLAGLNIIIPRDPCTLCNTVYQQLEDIRRQSDEVKLEIKNLEDTSKKLDELDLPTNATEYKDRMIDIKQGIMFLARGIAQKVNHGKSLRIEIFTKTGIPDKIRPDLGSDVIIAHYLSSMLFEHFEKESMRSRGKSVIATPLSDETLFTDWVNEIKAKINADNIITSKLDKVLIVKLNEVWALVWQLHLFSLESTDKIQLIRRAHMDPYNTDYCDDGGRINTNTTIDFTVFPGICVNSIVLLKVIVFK